jgi:ABC-2 type transport system permease protein
LTFFTLATTSAGPYGVLLPILGILAATGEWSQRTALVTFALEPRRARVAVAKLVAAGLAGLLAVVAALALAAVANVVGLLFFEGQGAWAFPLAHLAGAVLALLLVISVGVALGLALRSGPLAIVAFLALPTAWTFTSGLVTGLQPLAPWLDLPMATMPLLEATMRAADWAHLGTAGLVWFGLPFLIGVLRLTRGEVK